MCRCIVPGGGLSLARGEEGASPTGTAKSQRWVSCRPGFFLPVRVLSRLFRRLLLEKLSAAHEAGQLRFFNDLARLQDRDAFADLLARSRKIDWVVYAKRPFAGPESVLAYLSRYTHRVAISNSRLIALEDGQVTFRWKDYRAKGRTRRKLMTLAAHEFIRRFLLHVLPPGFHRIRHYGLFANGGRVENLARARQLLDQQQHAAAEPAEQAEEPPDYPCPCCGGAMVIIDTFQPGCPPRAPPATGTDGP